MGSEKYFDEIAERWDQVRAGFFSEAVRKKAFSVAALESGKTAADLGAGTGFITEGLLQKGLSVIAVDQSAAMLEQIKKKFGRSDKIAYRQADSEALPLPDSSVHYVFANMYLHHVEHPPQAIAEAARILQPGGKLVITDLDEHNFEFLRTEQQDRWMGFKREDVRGWLEAAGLKNVRVDCVGENCCADSAGGTSHAKVSIFVASGEKPVRPAKSGSGTAVRARIFM